MNQQPRGDIAQHQDADLTAKARIRNAAVALFARKGVRSATLREIAEAAGVTHGLVVHHFRNKDGLRRAVQEYVTTMITDTLDAVPITGGASEFGRARDAGIARMYAQNPDLLLYVRRETSEVEVGAGDPEFMRRLASMTLKQVEGLRTAGVARSKLPEREQAFAILLRQMVVQLMQPLGERVWEHLRESEDAPMPPVTIKLVTSDVDS